MREFGVEPVCKVLQIAPSTWYEPLQIHIWNFNADGIQLRTGTGQATRARHQNCSPGGSAWATDAIGNEVPGVDPASQLLFENIEPHRGRRSAQTGQNERDQQGPGLR